MLWIRGHRRGGFFDAVFPRTDPAGKEHTITMPLVSLPARISIDFSAPQRGVTHLLSLFPLSVQSFLSLRSTSPLHPLRSHPTCPNPQRNTSTTTVHASRSNSDSLRVPVFLRMLHGYGASSFKLHVVLSMFVEQQFNSMYTWIVCAVDNGQRVCVWDTEAEEEERSTWRYDPISYSPLGGIVVFFVRSLSSLCVFSMCGKC
ncbi:hypothetical protein E1B28_001878 [Marasmius oreades]|uniref:Uncharacterized protein n=1 Tax=Marasmius oreades TaxID=181124 RepID=A0A9P7V4H1_9AGAR|nr:uncharacterized protein E1B28_001878 [Marasmius oreades]KAG7100098.1 hypothetical protein E1B28_001878 [Marasmius oreades]